MWYFQELDFIYATYGALFFILGGVGWLLASRRSAKVLPWGLMAAICFIHGVNEWVFFFGVLFGSPAWVQWLPFIFLSAAFIVLLLLAHATFVDVIRIKPAQAYSGILAVLVMQYLACAAGYAVPVRYSMSLGGGLLVAIVFWRAAKKHGSVTLKLALIPLIVYALTGVIVMLPAEFYRSSNSYAQFWAVAHLFRAASVLCTVILVWYYAVTSRGVLPDAPAKNRSGFEVLRLASILLVAIICAGWGMTRKLGEQQAGTQKEALLSLVETLASSLNIRAMENVKDLSGRLERVTAEQRYFNRLYVFAHHPGGPEAMLRVNSTRTGEKLPQVLYGRDIAFNPVFGTMMASGKSVISEPERTSNGVFFHAIVPIKSPQGDIVAYLGAELDAFHYERQVRQARSIGIFITSLLLFIAVVYALGIEKMRDNRYLVELSDMRYKNIIHQNSAVMLLIEPESSVICEANEAAATYYGHPLSKLTGMELSDAIGVPAARIKSECAEVIKKKGCRFTSMHRAAGGEHRDVEVSAVPVTAEKTYIFLIVFDISERVRAQKDLSERAEFLKVLVEAVPIPLFVKDLAGKYINCNSAFCNFLGIERAQIMGKTVTDIQPPDMARFFMGKDAELLSSGETMQQFEHDLVIQDKPRFAIFSRAVFRGADGKKAGIIAVIQDTTELITAYRKLENAIALQRTLTELAEAGSRAKTDFLAMMSHEIRTPLNSIIGFTELLLASDLRGQQKEFLEAVYNSGRSLLVLVNDILDLSKIEADRLDLEKRPFLLSQCVTDITQMLSVRAQEKGLQPVRWEIEDNVPEVLVSDSGRLMQVLLNLTGNAIKFTEKGGVDIRVSAIRCAQKGEAPVFQIHFAVRDTGPGIEPRALARIFQPFTQGDSSTTRRFGGTGLGLTISRKLCNLFHGKLWVESVVGTGSTFHFTILAEGRAALPREKVSREKEPGMTSSTGKRSANILAVEDNPVNRKLLHSIMEKMEHSVSFAKSGREAVEMAKMGGYDLILMDLEMPDMDGYEATRQIRAEECRIGAMPVPIIALTAHATTGDKTRCRQSGMQDYLPKPVVAKDLSATIRKWMEPLYPVFVLCPPARESLQLEELINATDGIIPHFSQLREHSALLFARKYFAAVIVDAALGEAAISAFMREAREAGSGKALPFLLVYKDGEPCEVKTYLDMGFRQALPYTGLPECVTGLVDGLRRQKALGQL